MTGDNLKKVGSVSDSCAPHAIAWVSEAQEDLAIACEFSTTVSLSIWNYESEDVHTKIRLDRPCPADPYDPTVEPTFKPSSVEPTYKPTYEPTAKPTAKPTAVSNYKPTAGPTRRAHLPGLTEYICPA